MKVFYLFFFTAIFFLSVVFSKSSMAQIPNNNLSSLNVTELSDAQIRELLGKAKASGQTDAQLLQTAKGRGMSDEQVKALQNRITLIRNQSQQTAVVEDTSRKYNASSLDRNPDALPMFDAIIPRVFGSELFNGGGSSFEPNLRLATPVNYILGPDDQLIINVYGNSVDNWKLTVSPEGNINMPHVGIVNVSGKTIEQATATIKNELMKRRFAIGNGTTVKVSLGDIRSIKVIITGEVNKPGTYTLSSFSTVFNALYSSGGPNQNGSFRSIEILRNNKIIGKFDAYNFLIKGNQQDNIGLKDQDIIRIPNYNVRVQLSGEIKHPAIFEVLPGETLQDVLKFAGGFTDLAYFDRIKVTQIADGQRSIADVKKNDYSNYKPQNGDKYVVDRILERFSNRVTIEGAVVRPGAYALDNNLTLSKLIAKASGLRADAFTSTGSITRLNSDNTSSIISFNVNNIVNETVPDISLQREDLITISSIFDFRDNYMVTVKGEVRRPGDFAYADNMTLKNALMRAGGLTDAASPSRIEVSRRINNSTPSEKNGAVAKVFTANIESESDMNENNFQLKPYDIILVYTLPGFQKQQTVKIEGEVMYPGYYTIQTKNERLSDLIIKAGGLTSAAYPDGGTLKRLHSATLGYDKAKVDTAALQREQFARQKKINQSVLNDSTQLSNDQLRNNFVGIDLAKIIMSPGSKTDLLLADGDIIRVPKQQETVTINGEVLIPSSVVYSDGKSFKSYVSNAGGFSDRALKKRSYVLYPNGTVKGTRKFLFFNIYPAVRPGSEIYVPTKALRTGNFSQTAMAITGSVASLGLLIVGIITLRK